MLIQLISYSVVVAVVVAPLISVCLGDAIVRSWYSEISQVNFGKVEEG